MASSKKKRAYRDPHVESITRGLGWFSVGLGLAQIIAPRTVCRLVGLPPMATLTRLCGIRELACGIGIITQRNPSVWVKARVAGDAMDLAGLAVALPFSPSRAGRLTATAAVAAAVTALDVYCSGELAGRRAAPMHITTSITIDRPPEALYAFWRDLTNLPRVMPHLKSIRVIDPQRSHWTAHGPDGAIEWVSEIIDDKPNERLAWRSLEDAPVYNAGSVLFDALRDGSGTRVTVELLYDPPTGTVGASLAKLLGRTGEIRADLAAFQRLIESGAAAPHNATR
jgi:uncharacterized membrane protein